MSRASRAVERLLDIMARLRAPGGCPWDREQTLDTLRPYLLEETYEVLEAIDEGDPSAHREELGDLLLQIVFQAQIAEEERRFDFADVADAISDKLVSRHPHVFGTASADGTPAPEVRDSEALLRQWAALKRKENEAKGGGKSVLEGVPREMPALARAERLTEKASRVGFDWPDASGARAKVSEELVELDEAIASGDRARMEDELGDLLFAGA
ncbi:MAG TPA: nucleoside triphosphate pyrophosphohydrolase, partial [Anaeromyxobacteraceae bacterium]|nr:nucleoside triphosphate pyrophosphohydrolase [Anaeromyxobacteraceae bacterium]